MKSNKSKPIKPVYTIYYKRRRAKAQQAVRIYNAAVTRIEKQLGKNYAPPRRSVDELMTHFPTAKELDREIAKMKKIPKPSKIEPIRVGNMLTSEFAIQETRRLNEMRNKIREDRAKKYGYLAQTSGYQASQERALQRQNVFRPERLRDLTGYKKSLEQELQGMYSTAAYQNYYLEAIRKNYGATVYNIVRSKIKSIDPDVFYQMALEDDFRSVFEINFWYPIGDPNVDVASSKLSELDTMIELARERDLI